MGGQNIAVGLQQNLGLKQAIIGGKNYVNNPRFSGTTNGWTAGTGISGSAVTAGVQLTGSGDFYQSMNTSDVVSGTGYVMQVYVNAITAGTWTMEVGTTAGGADLATKTLAAGWNIIPFTAGSANFINITGASSSDIIVISEINVFEQLKLVATGGVVSGNSIVYISDTWRLYDDGTDLNVQKLESGSWVTKGAFSA